MSEQGNLFDPTPEQPAFNAEAVANHIAANAPVNTEAEAEHRLESIIERRGDDLRFEQTGLSPDAALRSTETSLDPRAKRYAEEWENNRPLPKSERDRILNVARSYRK